MSSFGQSDNPSILIVADAADPPFRDALAAISPGEMGIIVVPDVYNAMAQLTLVAGIRHVLIDVRQLDPHERSFLQLAPRYFRGVQLCIADVPGASARMRLEDSPTPMKSIAAFLASALAPSDEQDRQFDGRSWPERPAEQPQPFAPAPPAPREPLSTDGGSLSNSAAPSLHEAVRRRMADDVAATVQRKPPIRIPPRTAPTVSPQELDALLAPDDLIKPDSHPGDANTGRNR